VLLADGSVWTAGQGSDSLCLSGGACETCGETQFWPGGGDKAEIYYPPYYDDPRPTITSWPSSDPQNRLPRGQNFTVSYDLPPGSEFGSVAIIRPGSVTHSIDMTQLYVILDNQEPDLNQVSVIPPDAAYAPPGPYMLVVVDRAAVPSVAEWVYLQ
jgi:hypothetical protein